MKKIYLFFIVSLSIYFIFDDFTVIKANELLKEEVIYNIAVSDKYVAYEHSLSYVDNGHYISLFNTETKEINKIMTNNGELVNYSMYFPSISKDGKYLVFTSRADNITDDNIYTCIDISDGINKNCNNIYLYNIDKKQSTLIKYNGDMFNGDNYVAKISGNGNVIVFESISTNLLYNQYDCSKYNGIFSCINIYKYSILTGKTSLVSTGKNNYGSNANSVSPSVSYDGKYITYQSSSTNIVSNFNYTKDCSNYLTNEAEVCSNIYLVDTLNLYSKIISKDNNVLFDDNSGNSKISSDGNYVAFESYANNLYGNGKQHIYLYDTKNDTIRIVSKNNNILNNRNSYLDDISNDGSYLLYRSDSTNIGNGNMNLYVYSLNGFKQSLLSEKIYNVKFSLFNNSNVICYANDILYEKSIDSIAPVIEKNQEIYILYNNTLNIKDKIKVEDNLSTREKIDIYIDCVELLHNIGTYTINVTAVDEFNNSSISTVDVIVIHSDVEGPCFNETSEIKVLKGSSTLNLNNYIEAIDKVDGLTRIYIIDDGNLNLDVAGNYRIKLMSKDNSENISYKDIVIVVYENYNFDYFYEILIIIGILWVIIFSIIKVK